MSGEKVGLGKEVFVTYYKKTVLTFA